MAEKIEAVGQRYNRWTLVRRVSAGRWLCRCECGTEREKPVRSLRAGASRSCGCLAREASRTANTTHGESLRHTTSPELNSWSNMMQRCYNVRHEKYALYGGRGIVVCERWRSSFPSFLADLGRKPSPRHTLDRINVDGNYEPGNCRWATAREQTLNRRATRWITFGGQTKCLEDWARDIGIGPVALSRRIATLGLVPEAFSARRRSRWGSRPELPR